jgi:uncharacterized RDD family membrane protein YckC
MQAPTKVVGRRIVAYLIDFAILAVVVAGAWFALTSQQSGSCPPGGGGIDIGSNCRGFYSGDDAKRAIWFAIIAVAWLTLFAILPGVKGTSPGKAALGIRVVNEEGNPPGFFRGLVRGVFLAIDVGIIGLIVALVTQRNQRLGDLVASTFVVDKAAVGQTVRGGGQPAFAAAGGAQLAPPPTGQPVAQPPQPQQQQAAHKADWYPDPQGQARLRYWDGQRWTEHTSP